MRSEPLSLFRAVTASALVAIALPQSIAAQAPEHLVSPSELQKAAVGASEQRQQNIDTLRSFLSTDKAREAIRSAHMNPDQVTKAVGSLSDDELAQLTSRATQAQAKFSAGTISDRDLLIILIGLAIIILIVVAVN
jgi:hypothetical protein